MAKKIAVVLSGCGFKDGAEITESISTLINLSELGADYQIFAPDQSVTSVDHLTGLNTSNRNVLSESARISRGQSKDLSLLNPADFDGIVFPGGYGVALNLCTFAKDGSKGTVLPVLNKIIRTFHETSKPICAICIAPALIALALPNEQITLTVGNDKETASEIEKTGNIHQECPVNDYVSDREHKIITTPAYMYPAKPHEVYKGVQAAIRELVEMS